MEVHDRKSWFIQHKTKIRILGWTAIHFWLVFHLVAIAIAPASVAPSAPMIQQSWDWFSDYLQALYLNHGYHFFAPDPGGATLIQYHATLPDGSVKEERIPNFDIQPRLLYHRHFMLTEHMASTLYQRPEMEQTIAETFARQIQQKTGATTVVLAEVQHELSSPQQVLAGRPLNDPLTYSERTFGVLRTHEGHLVWEANEIPEATEVWEEIGEN